MTGEGFGVTVARRIVFDLEDPEEVIVIEEQ
jgi:hypothetical protein